MRRLLLQILIQTMVHILPTASLSTASSSTAAGAPSTSVSVNELLSTCVDACLRGCAEIRAVQRQRQKAGGTLNQVELKDVSDPKSALTEADGAAQTAVINALIETWGNVLEIVGEEDDQDKPTTTASTTPTPPPPKTVTASVEKLRKNLCLDIQNGDETVLFSDVTVFVDPLDGTREFVESRLSNCQTLVGVTIRGKPVAGAIGIPFPGGSLENETTVVYGHIGAGHGIVGTRPLMESNIEYSRVLPRPFVASGDSTAKVMVSGRKIALKVAEDDGKGTGSSVLYGGAGNKILATAAGHVDCTIQHKYGGPWDTCAPEAVLRAMGGRITTWTGEEIRVTHKDAKSSAINMGFVATGANSAIDHDKLVAALRDSQDVQDYYQAVQNSSS